MQNLRLWPKIISQKIYFAILLPPSLYILLTLENIKLFFSQTDAFLYLGYGVNYAGLQNHWGHTYPASRISTIIPIMAREYFGIPDQIWRIGLLSIISLSAYFFLSRRIKYGQSFLISILSTNIVWLMDHLSDDMNFGYAIVYATLSLVIYDAAAKESNIRRQAFFYALTGFFTALTLNSHFIYLFVFVPIYVTAALVYAKNYREMLRNARHLAFGFFLTYLGILVVSIDLSGRTGLANHLSLAKQFIVNSGESGRIWTKPLLYFFPFVVIILLIPIFGLLKFKDYKKSKYQFEYVLSAGVLVMGIFSILYHLISGGPILSITRYCSIYLGPIILILSLLLKDLSLKILGYLLALEAGVILFVQIFPGWQTSDRLISIIRLVLFVPSLMYIFYFLTNRKTHSIQGISALVIVACMPITQAWGSFSLSTKAHASPNGEYREFLNSMNSGTWVDQQNFATFIAKLIKNSLPPTYYGWTIYPNSPEWLGGIDATQLWGYSCYRCMNLKGLPTTRTYPPFTQNDIVELRKRDYILIFDVSKKNLLEASRSLLEAASDFKPNQVQSIQGTRNVLYYQIIFTGLQR